MPPSPKHIPLTDIAPDAASFLERAATAAQPVIVEKDGMAIVALVSPANLERWTRQDRARKERWRVMDEIRARNAGKDPEEIERDVAEEIEEMRRERRAAGVPPTAP